MGSFRPQVVSSGVGTVSGGVVDIPLNPVAIGELMAVRITQDVSGSFNLVIEDSRGYDILRGLGSGASGKDVSINANSVGGNPCQGQLTAKITGATNGHVFAVDTYIKSNTQLRALA